MPPRLAKEAYPGETPTEKLFQILFKAEYVESVENYGSHDGHAED